MVSAATIENRRGIASRTLTAPQVEALALLGRVWGFAKYHHPSVTGGDVDGDAELLAMVPEVLEAGSPDAAQPHLDAWLAELGDLSQCDPCAELPHDLHLERV